MVCKGEGLVCSKVVCVGESGWQCKQLQSTGVLCPAGL